MKKNILVLIVILLASYSCQKEDPVVTAITLPQTISLDIGATQKITPSHLPSELQAPLYVWQSSDATIFTVDNQGNISAIGVGEATLTVKSTELNLTASSKVTVLPIAASGVIIRPESTSLLIGESIQLEATVQPENTTDKTITWESLDETIATVTEDGMVEAVGLGKTRITATSGEASGFVEITVDPILAEELILNVTEVNLLVGSTATLSATIEPENTTNKDITWSSSDEEIAQVSDGVITAKGVGKAVITATCGNATSTCEVTVDPVKVTGINLMEETLNMEMSDFYKLTAIIHPENATNKNILWTSEDTNIAVVDEDGMVAAVNEGTTRIVATTEDGNLEAACEVVVTLKGLSLNTEYLQMLPGTTDVMHVTYLTNGNAYLHATWTSSNPDVATVTGEGPGTNSAVIESKEVGTTVITATSADGTKKASCTIEVVEITDFINLSFILKSFSNLNGFIHGDIYSRITNTSPYPIELFAFYIYDGQTGRIVASQIPTEVRTLSSGANTNLGTKFNSVYNPIFVWHFTWNGKDYSVQHQFTSSFRSTGSPTDKLNMIEPLEE